MMNLVDETIRFLTFEFLRYGDPTSTARTLSLFANPPCSPLTGALQYLASLCLSDSARLVLVYMPRGFQSAEAWEEERPEEVRCLRRLVILASSWIQRRHCDRLMQIPFALTCLSDPSVSPGFKQELSESWDALNLCCARPGIARQLKQRGITAKDLFSEKRLWLNLLRTALIYIFAPILHIVNFIVLTVPE